MAKKYYRDVITINKAKCLICDDMIESTHRHDFVTCSCGNLSVDGGHDYLRRCIGKIDMYEDMSASHQEERLPYSWELEEEGKNVKLD